MKLLLFDLDGTILRSTRGAEPFGATMREVFGLEIDGRGFRFDGKTDPLIIAELLQSGGVTEAPRVEMLRTFEEALAVRLADAVTSGTTRVEAIPGVREVLTRLAADPDFALAVLTGNFERTARVKLHAAGLEHFFPVGAFGSDAAERAALPAIARERYVRGTGRTLALGDCVIIGDTVLDHAAAEANGIACVLIASGRTPLEELERLRPAALFADWNDGPAMHAALAALRGVEDGRTDPGAQGVW